MPLARMKMPTAAAQTMAPRWEQCLPSEEEEEEEEEGKSSPGENEELTKGGSQQTDEGRSQRGLTMT